MTALFIFSTIMAVKEFTSPPAAAVIASSPVTPAAKRLGTVSPPEETVEATSSVVPAQVDYRAAETVTATNTTETTVSEGHVEGFDDVVAHTLLPR